MTRGSDISTEFKQDGQMLVCRADIAHGWRRFPKGGFGFCKPVTQELKGDWKVRVQLKLEGRGGRDSSERESLPEELEGKYTGKGFAAVLRRGKATVVVDLVEAAANIVGPSRKSGLFEGPCTMAQKAGIRYDFSIWVIFTPPPGQRPRDVREWDVLPFLPGGLPETNRRRF